MWRQSRDPPPKIVLSKMEDTIVQPKRRFVEALQNMDIEIVKAMVNKIALKGVSQIIYGRLENSRRNIGDVRISVQ